MNRNNLRFMISDFRFKKLYPKPYTLNPRRGFSLVETLVAITVLLFAITGPLTIAHRAISDSRVAKNQTTAIFLAQDAMEHIRNVRDSNNIDKAGNWLRYIDACSSTCIVDTLNTAPNSIDSSCGGSDCPALRFDSSSGLYGYNSGWAESIFTRTITLSSLSANEAEVTVNVNWGKGVMARSLSLKENILNWQE
jgi:prepilin-type N-terminal cleavage/methylation domain-containing protein